MAWDLTKRLPALPELSHEKLKLYLAYLSLDGAKRHAALKADLDPYQVQNLMHTNKDLALLQQEALEEYKERIDLEIHRRAIDGEVRPVYHKGIRVGAEVVKSDRLLEFMAKANNPEKYKDRVQVDANIKAGVLVVNTTLDPDDWEQQYGDMRIDKSRLDRAGQQPGQAGQQL